MRSRFFALCFALSACGQSPEDAAAPESTPPTEFGFAAKDMLRDPPNDICRYRNDQFLMDLIDRATAPLVEIGVYTKFDDFNVVDDMDGREGKSAIIRIKVRENDTGQEEFYFATGSFDSKTCAIGKLTVGKGAHPLAPDAQTIATN